MSGPKSTDQGEGQGGKSPPMGERDEPRRIVHVDMDAFYAQM